MEENVRIVLALSDLIELYPGITVTIGVVYIVYMLHVELIHCFGNLT